jgi:hypothetical protein
VKREAAALAAGEASIVWLCHKSLFPSLAAARRLVPVETRAKLHILARRFEGASHSEAHHINC